jgi:uncharacterized protein YbcI
MDDLISSIAKQIAGEAAAFEQRTTGREPESVMVTVCDKTLVVTMVTSLTPAERATAVNSIGAAQVQAYHRELFVSASDNLSKSIEQITGVRLGAATVRVDPGAGTIVEGLSTGSDLDVFVFARCARSPPAGLLGPASVGRTGAVSGPSDEWQSTGGAKTHGAI